MLGDKTHFDSDDILSLLKLLNDELASRGEHAELVMGGGAVMTTCHHSRATTQDIDAVFRPSLAVLESARSIAEREGIELSWLNDGFKGFINPKGAKTIPFVKFSNLSVSRFDDKTMLALKLTSARSDSDKDYLDSLSLLDSVNPQSIEDLYKLVEEKSYPQLLTVKVDLFIQNVYLAWSEQKRQEGYSLDEIAKPPIVKNNVQGQSRDNIKGFCK